MSSSTSRAMTRGTNASDTDGKFMGPGPFDSMLHAKAAFGGAVVLQYHARRYHTYRCRQDADAVGTSEVHEFHLRRQEHNLRRELGCLVHGCDANQGYLVQGWCKFGGVEICKTRSAMGMSEQDAWKNRDFITLGGSVAEFVADVFLCPYEACRIRSVSDPSHANGMLATGQKLVAESDVVNGLYSDFGPMLFKQIPYTMAKFSVQQ